MKSAPIKQMIKLYLPQTSFEVFIDWWREQGFPTNVKFQSVGINNGCGDSYIILEKCERKKEKK